MLRLIVPFAFLVVICPSMAEGQTSIRDSSIASPMLSARIGYHVPGRDMAARFGSNASIGGAFLFKTKTNWVLGLQADFLFGDRIKEEGILNPISTKPDADGNRYIIDGNGTYAEVFLYERGFTIMPTLGYLFPVAGPNPNSGLLITGSIGFLQHRIRIENRENTAAQLKGDLKKGYDRLSNGLAYQQFIGYLHMGNSHLVNFFAGIEVTEGFTRNRRTVNYDTGMYDPTHRLDMLYGIRFGWIIPFYRRPPEKRYYY